MRIENRRSRDISDNISNLINRIAEGDEDSYAELYEECKNLILSNAYAITRDLHLSEDVLQETMVYLWLHAPEYKAINPRSWISLIARHIAVDIQRKQKNTVSIDSFNETDMPIELSTASYDDAHLTIRMGIDRLDGIESQVFILKAMAGLPHSTIATVLGISVRSSRYRYRCSIEKLRDVFSD